MSRKVLDKAHTVVMEGSPKQAKYAARFLAFTRNSDRTCSDLVEVCFYRDHADVIGSSAKVEYQEQAPSLAFIRAR